MTPKDPTDDAPPERPYAGVTLPRRQWQDNRTVRYKVYSSPQDFIMIEAQTASQAVSLSGIEKPYAVRRFIQDHEFMVDDQTMTDMTDRIEISPLEQLNRQNPVIENQKLNALLEEEENQPEPQTAETNQPATETEPAEKTEAEVITEATEEASTPETESTEKT